MSVSGKITASHLERVAIVYVRQSSIAQLRHHTESTARQYALAEEAARLGWEASRIVTIDADLGVSARVGSDRTGFKELVGRVCIGEVGAIFGLEVSRLARSSADLQRLLELCSLTDTLIIDADGIYDLSSFNDRLLLGLKGTMSEAELHVLAGRLQGAKRAAAERGELRTPLPVGYVHEDEATVMDPDEEIRGAVTDVFSAFEATGSAYGVVRSFLGRRFPRRAYGGAWAGEIRWGRLTHSRALGMLANPAYSGAYVFGRYRSRRTVDPDGTIRTRTVELPRGQWAVLILDHHPAYIPWETFLANQERLAANCTRRQARPPREGMALLQGIVFCGACGRAMSTRYQKGKGHYDCSHSRADHVQTLACRSVLAEVVDGPVAKRLLEAVTPEEIAVALAAAEEVAERRGRATRALELRVERGRYEAARAERAFHQCDPDNRLVARSLEQRWEEKLRELAEAEQEFARQANEPLLPARTEIEGLARDLPRLWVAPSTSARDRKRLFRALIADVTLTSEPKGKTVRIGIHWRSGATEELVVRRPSPAHVLQRTSAEAVELVKQLGPTHRDAELAHELNRRSLVTGLRRTFDEAAVRWVRFAYQVPSPPLLAPNELSVRDMAARLGVSEGVVYYWIERDQLAARRGPGNRLCVPFSPEVEQASRERIARSSRIVPRTQTLAVRGAV